MTGRLSDEILMQKLSRGDKNAAGVLYDRYYKKLYGYFIRMTKDMDAARDLTQNVFVKVIKYSHSWKDDKVFAYWIFHIAKNILIDYYNGAKKFYGLENDPEIAEMDREESFKTMEAKESYEFLLEAMTQLPPGYRELIELNRFQGFTYKEIAQATLSTENAVKVKTFRAIQKLKEIYTKIIIE